MVSLPQTVLALGVMGNASAVPAPVQTVGAGIVNGGVLSAGTPQVSAFSLATAGPLLRAISCEGQSGGGSTTGTSPFAVVSGPDASPGEEFEDTIDDGSGGRPPENTSLQTRQAITLQRKADLQADIAARAILGHPKAPGFLLDDARSMAAAPSVDFVFATVMAVRLKILQCKGEDLSGITEAWRTSASETRQIMQRAVILAARVRISELVEGILDVDMETDSPDYGKYYHARYCENLFGDRLSYLRLEAGAVRNRIMRKLRNQDRIKSLITAISKLEKADDVTRLLQGVLDRYLSAMFDLERLYSDLEISDAADFPNLQSYFAKFAPVYAARLILVAGMMQMERLRGPHGVESPDVDAALHTLLAEAGKFPLPTDTPHPLPQFSIKRPNMPSKYAGMKDPAVIEFGIKP